jgi:hypothetical protein
MKFTLKIILLLFLGFTSCKSKKNMTNSNTIKMVSTKKIINNHYENSFHQQTINAKINAKYKNDKTAVTIGIKLRMEKDKTIWMSATKMGIPIAKILITPNKVSFYEKLNKTYFDGDFELLSNWLGTELDFEKIQNILLGQAIFDLKKEKYDTEIVDKTYQLTPKKNNELFDILFFINPENFKINKQEILQPEKEQILTVSYPNYKEINGEQFPQKINITAIDNKKPTIINIDYRSVEFNKKTTFPFSIPSGYKEISLK